MSLCTKQMLPIKCSLSFGRVCCGTCHFTQFAAILEIPQEEIASGSVGGGKGQTEHK